MSRFKLFGIALAIIALPALALDLTDTWSDPENPGVRAVLVQHHDTLALDLHQEMSSSGISRLHAPALDMIGLDANGHRVFAGESADGLVGVSVSTVNSGTVAIELDAPGGVQRLRLERPQVEPIDLGGRYLGGYGQSGATCLPFVGRLRERKGVWTIHYPDGTDPSRIALRFSASDGRQICHFHGQQTDLGKIARVNGDYDCNSGERGAFSLDPIERGEIAFGGAMQLETTQCGRLRLKIGGFRYP
jgi:hypothetical protein